MSLIGIGVIGLGGVIVLVVVWNVIRFGIPAKHTRVPDNNQGLG